MVRINIAEADVRGSRGRESMKDGISWELFRGGSERDVAEATVVLPGTGRLQRKEIREVARR